jgi:hypothetical protein
MGKVYTILKKIFSITLIFNSLVTLGVIIGILYGFYNAYPYWHPFAPYLLDGNLLWLAFAAAAINIFPSACIGRALHTGRFLFHHYVYGFIVLIAACSFVVLFSPVNLLYLFLITTSNLTVNVGRFFVLGGLTLLLDDLPDVSDRVEVSLNWVKRRACEAQMILHALQLVTGLATLYILAAILLSTAQNPSRALSLIFLISTLIITVLTSLAHVIRKDWLKITPP